MKKTTSTVERATNDNASLETRTEVELDKRSKLSKGIEGAKNVAGAIVGCTIMVPFLIAATMGSVGEILEALIVDGAATLYDSGKEGCRKIAQACKGTYLFCTSTSDYVLYKAEKKNWEGIELRVERLGGLNSGYLVMAQKVNPTEHDLTYKIYFEPGKIYATLKRPNNGKKVVMRDEADLDALALAKALYYLKREFLPKATKKGIRTDPDLPEVNQQIEPYESMLQKYLQ